MTTLQKSQNKLNNINKPSELKMRLPSIRTLVNISLYTGVVGVSALMLMKYKITSDIRNSEYFRNAMIILRSHPGAVKYLGEPIKDIGFDLGDSSNFCYENKAQFEVSVKGPNDKGKIFFWAEREESAENKEWVVNRLELELKSVPDKRLIIRKQS